MSKIECNACPVLCQITQGRAGACDRYANVDGVLTRVDPIVLMKRDIETTGTDDVFVTGVGSGTTYPDYKPAPFIVSSQFQGADTVTVVTEGRTKGRLLAMLQPMSTGRSFFR
jgi:6-hydroxynicotinate reductase